MAKYGFFGPGMTQPMQTFEGDSIQQNGDHVQIFRHEDVPNERLPRRVLVGAIKLGEGQYVKEIT